MMSVLTKLSFFPVRRSTAPGKPSEPLLTPATAFFGLAFVLLCAPVFSAWSSADLQALWTAGLVFSEGRTGLIYPPDTTVFTVLPPEAWLSGPTAEGYVEEFFPFIYPPLWVWVMAKLAGIMEYTTLRSVATVLNPALLIATLLLAHRLSAPAMRQTTFLVIGLALLMQPTLGLPALMQNQPQIVVAFLTLLAFERAEHGSPRVAGAALALAAAIKLYPVLFAVIWLASGQRRAFGAFVMFGAALAAMSVAVAGWPLHAVYLDLIRVISNTALVTPIAYTIDATLAQTFMADSLTAVIATNNPPDMLAPLGWYVLAKPEMMVAVNRLMQILVLGFVAMLMARNPDETKRAALWPFAMIMLALLGPISWGYHYIAAVAFMPMFFDRVGSVWATCLVIVFMIFMTPSQMLLDLTVPKALTGTQVVGTLALLGTALVFFLIRNLPSRAARPA